MPPRVLRPPLPLRVLSRLRTLSALTVAVALKTSGSVASILSDRAAELVQRILNEPTEIRRKASVATPFPRRLYPPPSKVMLSTTMPEISSSGVGLLEFAGKCRFTGAVSPAVGTPPALQFAELLNRSLMPFPLQVWVPATAVSGKSVSKHSSVFFITVFQVNEIQESADYHAPISCQWNQRGIC